MAHSVRRHLRVEASAYDEAIRSFVPGYGEVVGEVARLVGRAGARSVLDIGAGTGGLSEAVLRAVPLCRVQLLDQDLEMLEQARVRLLPFADRTLLTEGSFFEPLPPHDAMIASLSLHHIACMDVKRSMYHRIREALPSGGIFVNADIVLPHEPAPRASVMTVWLAHMAACGIDAEAGKDHIKVWSKEDTYFSIEEEMDAMAVAGLMVDCTWRCGPMAVLAGWKGDPTCDR